MITLAMVAYYRLQHINNREIKSVELVDTVICSHTSNISLLLCHFFCLFHENI